MHLVDETLLSDARRRGLDDDVRERLTRRLRELVAQGSDVVVCSCSTLGGAVESLGVVDGVQIMRVDRPMAEEAAATGPPIALADQVDVVVLAQASMAPACDLLDDMRIPVLCSPPTAIAKAIELVALRS